MSGASLPELDACDRERFREFFATEQPVVMRHATTSPATASELRHELNARIAGDPTASLQELCWDVRPDVVAGMCSTPAVVADALYRQSAFLRDHHVRLWFNERGHRTLWHYDGHSLHVFNLQLKGSKRWRLVAPETPLTCMPFTSVGLFAEPALARARHFEVETREGDLLFVPRHWYHSVDALGELNINVNWVLTPRTPSRANATARREAELTWLKARIRPLLGKRAREYNERYAGCGATAIDLLTRGVTLRTGLTRALKETLKLPLLVPGLVSLRRNLAAVRRSTRLLQALVAAERESPALAGRDTIPHNE